MNWLAQNWLWVIFIIAIAWFFLGRGHNANLGGHGGGLMGGMGHGGHGYGSSAAEEPAAPQDMSSPEAAIDPVSGQPVRTTGAVTSIHEGKIYYFVSRENRDRFEAAPEEYAHKVAGQPIRAASAERTHRHHGC